MSQSRTQFRFCFAPFIGVSVCVMEITRLFLVAKISCVSPMSYKRGVCRPLEEESSFCLGLSTRPVSEIVPVCLNPRFFSSHYFVVMRFLEK